MSNGCAEDSEEFCEEMSEQDSHKHIMPAVKLIFTCTYTGENTVCDRAEKLIYGCCFLKEKRRGIQMYQTLAVVNYRVHYINFSIVHQCDFEVLVYYISI